VEGADDRRVDALRDFGGSLNVVLTVDHDLRLDDGAEAVSLADGGIASEAPSLLLNEQVGRLAGLDVNPIKKSERSEIVK